MQDKANSRKAQDLARAYQLGVLLAHAYDKEKPPPNPKGWWVSEKLDGVRAYWNGEDFFSRTGNIYAVPDFFKEGLPKNHHLDGELWLGREQFEACVGIVRTTKQSAHNSEDWRRIKYVVFDAPVIQGRVDVPYEERHAACERIAASAPFASAVKIRKCTGKAHMQELLDEVVGLGGEGLMLREPGSLYERTRSHSLLKVKTFLDAEAIVIGHSKDKKLEGCMGALECEMPVTGVRFKIGSGFKMDERPMRKAKKQWPAGTVVSYKYQGLTTANSKPRFPSYVRMCTDKSWDEVVMDARSDLDAEASGKRTAAAAAEDGDGEEGVGSKSAATQGAAARGRAAGDAASASAGVPGKRRKKEKTYAVRGEAGSDSGRKFWQVKVAGNEMITTFGRMGANGTTKTKEFGSNADAIKEAKKMTAKKKKGGYVMGA